MELALSLGDSHNTPKPIFPFLDHHKAIMVSNSSSSTPPPRDDLGFCMGGLASNLIFTNNSSCHSHSSRGGGGGERDVHQLERKGSSDPPSLQLDLLPFSPVVQRRPAPPPPPPPPPPSHLRFPWLAQNLIAEPGKGLKVNRQGSTATTVVEEGDDGAALSSSPNSAVSSYSHHHHHQMDFTSMFRKRKRDFLEAKIGGNSANSNSNNSGEVMIIENVERGISDEEDVNGLARKKLRLTKDQSAFLEESFKEHNTLNPKQKLALAKQLNLRPRQVEVWFQNRRARTKLKQTEVDCEYLKRCCETLTEENRRLQKELQELRALKSSKPFYMQHPATTLTMCPSCEKVASTTGNVAAGTGGSGTVTTTTNTTLSLARPRLDE